MVTRIPPVRVREFLRKEVNFGCPVEGCGKPYLTWHHFDPPFHEKPHHNPEGMIALCPTCHGHATGGRWTIAQLKKMKKNPFVSREKICENYGYLRKNVVCFIGNIAYNIKNILEVDGERVIGFEKDEEGYNRLNILIKDSEGKKILEMKNNFWTAYTSNIFDLRCSAFGKELEIVSHDKTINFFMRFDDYYKQYFKGLMLIKLIRVNEKIGKELTPDQLNQLRYDVNRFIVNIGNPRIIPTWTIKGRIKHLKSYIEIKDTEIVDLNRNIRLNMIIVENMQNALNFSSKGFTIG